MQNSIIEIREQVLMGTMEGRGEAIDRLHLLGQQINDLRLLEQVTASKLDKSEKRNLELYERDKINTKRISDLELSLDLAEQVIKSYEKDVANV